MHAGITLSRGELERLAEMTGRAGAWLVLDETYEDFLFSGQEHFCPSAPHVVHLFSFSKVWGHLCKDCWCTSSLLSLHRVGRDFQGSSPGLSVEMPWTLSIQMCNLTDRPMGWKMHSHSIQRTHW